MIAGRPTPGVGGVAPEPRSGAGRQRIPPAAVPRHLQQPRHDEPPHDPDRLERARLGDGLRSIQLQPRIRGVLERRGEWRLAVPGALGRPALAPFERRRGRHLAMRAGQPDEAPAPWHDPVRVVAAATGRQPATAGRPVREPIDQPGRLAHRGRGHAQVRERIPRVRVGSVLRHDEVRPERGGQFGEQHLDRRRAMPPPRSRARAARSRTCRRPPPRPAPPPRPCPGTGTARSRGRTPSTRPGPTSGSPGRRRRDGRRGPRTARAARRVAPGRSPAPGRRRCRSPTRGRASRGGARRPGGRRARRRRAGSPRARGSSHRRPSPRRRASRRTAGRRRPRRCRPPASRTGSPRTA